MAASDDSNRVEHGVVELEAMRKDTFSWHPCQVSLCSSALGLVLRYGDNNLEETISDKHGVLAHVRIRSIPLQGDDCTLLQRGDRVLATRNSQVKGLFYDAEVEEAFRVRHSKRNPCRCSFKIKWLHQAIEEKAWTVPASAIKKLSMKSIVLHPTISTFFSMLESSNDVKASPVQLSLDNMKLEVDISMLLAKQIEDINRSSDAPENMTFGLKGDLIEQTHVSLKDLCFTNKESSERTVKDIPDSITPNPEQFMGRRSPLSPLAARAALASLRSNFCQSAERSVHSIAQEGDIYGSDFSPITDDTLLKSPAAASGGRSKKFESIVKTLFPAPSSPPEIEFSDGSSGTQENEVEKKRKIKGKWTAHQPSEKRRVTRSQVQKNNKIQESTQMTNVNEKQLSPIPKTRRATRSNGHKEYTAAAEESMETAIRPQSRSSDVQYSVVSPVDGEDNILPTENDKDHLGKDGLTAKVDPQKNVSAKDNCSRRMTRSRSAAAREEMKNEQSNIKHGHNNISELNKLDLSKGSGSTEHNSSEGKIRDARMLPMQNPGVGSNGEGATRRPARLEQETHTAPSALRSLPRTSLKSQRKVA